MAGARGASSIFWIGEGVRIFRVDNPHTKPFPFWEWVDRGDQARASRRRSSSPRRSRGPIDAPAGEARLHAVVHVLHLAQHQGTSSPNTSPSSRKTPSREYFRPNCWPNTPDILHEYLQSGLRAAFIARLVLAATLAPTTASTVPRSSCWSTFRASPAARNTCDSEKYQISAGTSSAPTACAASSRASTRIRRDNPALHADWRLRFFDIDNPQLICYCQDDARTSSNVVIVVVNLDPHNRQSGWVDLDLAALGLDVRDHRSSARPAHRRALSPGSGARNFVELRSHARSPAHILRLRKHVRSEHRSTTSNERSAMSRHGVAPDADRPDVSVRRPTRSGTRTRSSTSCTSRRSTTRNDDGIGDFAGLTEKLDYIRDLGVNTIWLLPFYPSPLRDDGYDVADYHNVHPHYGTRADFRHFVREAHRRGLRVITELVVNHTSDQHPWFQAARRAPKGSAKRNFYVWSDDPEAVRRHAHHLHRHREVELDVGRRRPAVLLAPLLQPPARPELRQPAGAEGDASRPCASGSTWAWTASGSTRFPTCSSAKARTTRTCPRRTTSSSRSARQIDAQLPRPPAARRGEPVARGRARILRRRRRMPHGVSTSR